MRSLSAIDAVSPAFSRTKLILLTPFLKGRTWKFCITGYLGMSSVAFLPFPLIYLCLIPMAKTSGTEKFIPLIVLAVSVFTAFYIFIFYLCSRLRFAFFDVVLRRDQFIAPLWRKHGPASNRWATFKVLAGTIASVFLAPPVTIVFRSFFIAVKSFPVQPGQQPPPQVFTGIISAYIALFLLYALCGLFYFLSSIAGDFVVPSLALENTTLREAFRRMGKLIQGDTGQFLLYVVVKLGLGIGGYMALGIAFEIVFVLVMMIGLAIAAAAGSLMHLLHIPTMILIVLGIAVAVALYLFLMVYAFPIMIGSLLIMLESYMLYFLGGRYPMLGELLESATPPPPAPIPAASYAAPPAWSAPPAA